MTIPCKDCIVVSICKIKYNSIQEGHPFLTQLKAREMLQDNCCILSHYIDPPHADLILVEKRITELYWFMKIKEL